MPIDIVDPDRNRVLGVVIAYLRGTIAINAIYGAVRSSSFRNQELDAILTQAETGARDVGTLLKEDLMGTLRDGLKERGFLA